MFFSDLTASPLTGFLIFLEKQFYMKVLLFFVKINMQHIKTDIGTNKQRRSRIR
jgi:hypothetical protein